MCKKAKKMATGHPIVRPINTKPFWMITLASIALVLGVASAAPVANNNGNGSQPVAKTTVVDTDGHTAAADANSNVTSANNGDAADSTDNKASDTAAADNGAQNSDAQANANGKDANNVNSDVNSAANKSQDNADATADASADKSSKDSSSAVAGNSTDTSSGAGVASNDTANDKKSANDADKKPGIVDKVKNFFKGDKS